MDTATVAIITAVVSALSSGGVCSIILYLIQRRDKKSEDTLKKAVDRLEKLEERIEKQDESVARISKAVVAQMHHTMYESCGEILTEYADGKRTCMDTDAFHDLSIMYDAYKDLGGNGTCKILFERVGQIPLRQTNQVM